MNLELDHFFILTDKPKETGDLLLDLGLEEGFSRDHKGQGTSNRRFVFSNGMLELLYVRDVGESKRGPAKNLRFPDRVANIAASPFGVVLTRLNSSDTGMPFSGWPYQPYYFDPPNAFHVGDNAGILQEPLCIYVPFADPVKRQVETGKFRQFSGVELLVPGVELSETLQTASEADRLQVRPGDKHLAVVTLDEGRLGQCKDCRPYLPLIIKW